MSLVIKYVEENYDRIFDDLKKFDMFKRSHAKKSPLIPHLQIRKGRLFMIVNQQHMRSYCSDISGLIQLALLEELDVKSKVVYGEFNGSGKRFSNARFNRHAWVELGDGTIIDGSYIQYQPENKKNPIRLKIVKPDDKFYKNYEKSERELPEETPLPYIIEAKNKKYSKIQEAKEYKYWHGRKKPRCL